MDVMQEHLNMPKIKGSHTAMKSGIIAAETINEHLKSKRFIDYLRKSLKKVGYIKNFISARNVKPSFSWGINFRNYIYWYRSNFI